MDNSPTSKSAVAKPIKRKYGRLRSLHVVNMTMVSEFPVKMTKASIPKDRLQNMFQVLKSMFSSDYLGFPEKLTLRIKLIMKKPLNKQIEQSINYICLEYHLIVL